MKHKQIKQKYSPSDQYPPFNEWKWHSYDGTKSIDPDNFISAYKNQDFYVGTDSQNYKGLTVYTTVIISHHKNRGGSIIIHSDKTITPSSLRHKLLMEAMRSLEAAYFVNQRIPSKSNIVVHLDVNSNLKWKSGQYKDELVGLIMAQGFNVRCKPDAWASSSAADRKT